VLGGILMYLFCQFPYEVALVRVHVDCAGARQGCVVVLVHICSAGFFFVNFRIKWLLCMRMSTVQAPGKYVCRHFTSEFPYKGDDDDAVGDAFDWCDGGEGWRSIYYVLVI
jgi:hypothetical protein